MVTDAFQYIQDAEAAKRKERADAAARKAQAETARKAGIQTRMDQLRSQVGQVKTTPLGMEGPAQADTSTYQDAFNSDVGQAYQAKKIQGPLPEYDYLRNKANEQINQASSAAQDAIQRRFASMGALNSGAAIKSQQLQQENTDKQKADTLQGIGFQEAQARRALENEEAQKEYQSQEALKGRKFSADEASLGRRFSADQAKQARNFEAQQQVLQRNMQREFFNADQQFKNDVFKFESGTKIQGLEQAWQQFELDKENTDYNKEQNEWTKRHSGGLFGAGGFLGLGFGIDD